MGTIEQQAHEAKLHEARSKLAAAMKRIPFDINSCGAIRIAAWKTACAEAQKVLNRNPKEIDKYHEALRSIEQCATAPPSVLAIEMYGTDYQRAQLANGVKS